MTLKSKEQNELLTTIARWDEFKRLAQSFRSIGWDFFYLNGESCMAIHRKWRMSQVCQTYRDAQALLRRVGGN
jgi:hypothetical protein